MTRIVWFEVPAEDRRAQLDFYCNVLGWGKTSYGGPEMFDLGGNLGGEPTADVEHPVIYFEVADIEAVQGRVEAAGGAVVVPKTEIGGGMGFYARLRDPEGHVFGVWARE
jgi:hypothetical protein